MAKITPFKAFVDNFIKFESKASNSDVSKDLGYVHTALRSYLWQQISLCIMVSVMNRSLDANVNWVYLPYVFYDYDRSWLFQGHAKGYQFTSVIISSIVIHLDLFYCFIIEVKDLLTSEFTVLFFCSIIGNKNDSSAISVTYRIPTAPNKPHPSLSMYICMSTVEWKRNCM